MTSSSMNPATAFNSQPNPIRELFNTILSYMAWGYGALLLSLVAYGSYSLFRWLAKNPESIGVALTVLFMARLVTALRRVFDGHRSLTLSSFLRRLLLVAELVFLSWELTIGKSAGSESATDARRS
jgi:hypothetical protein